MKDMADLSDVRLEDEQHHISADREQALRARLDDVRELLEDRTRLLDACDLVLATRSTPHMNSALDNLKQIVESVRK